MRVDISDLKYGEVDTYPLTVVFCDDTKDFRIANCLTRGRDHDGYPTYQEANNILHVVYTKRKQAESAASGEHLGDLINIRAKHVH